MIALTVNNITKSFGANTVFENLSMDLQEGERLGLIGPNGCGKTTLMKILMGSETIDSGEIAFKKGTTVGYLNQMPVYEAGMSVREVMSLAFADLLAMKKGMEGFEKDMTTLQGEALEKALVKYGELSHSFETKGGYDMATRLAYIAEGLSIPDDMLSQSFDKLSGGEKTRVELAKTLLERPQVLLLDEPSNHLDMTAIEWLEDFLKNYSGAAIIISHDRYFLDRVVNRVVEMSYDRLTVYHGNYSYYVVEKERRFLIDLKFYQNQQKEIKRVENQIKRYRVWGVMRDSEKMFKKAKELEKRLEKMDKVSRPKFDNAKVNFAFNGSNRSGKRVLSVEGLEKSFGERKLFAGVDLDLFFGESLCLVGDNGSGKSTLLKMIISEAIEDPYVWINHQDVHDLIGRDQGIIKLGSRIKVGYLAQEVAFEDQELTLLDYFAGLHDLSDSEARRELAKVLFVKEDIFKKIGTLSGGEKSRLKLCSLMYEQVNLMVLDEPTNHLDIDSREILEEMLIDYPGTLLFVSHDRYFIAKIANRMAEIHKGALVYYGGNYDYYREEKNKEKAFLVAAVSEEDKDEGKSSKARRFRSEESKKVPQKYLVEQKTLETKIGALEEKQGVLAEQMTVHASDGERLRSLYEENQAVEEDLLEAYERWEQLMEIITGV